MKIEPKVENNLSIMISNQGGEILADETIDQNYPLTPGAIIGGEHFGFKLIIDLNGQPTETMYPTQFRIDAVGIEENELRIYEEHKYMPWKFKTDGTYISEAVFLENSRRDANFLSNEYGIVGSEQIAEVNSFRKKR